VALAWEREHRKTIQRLRPSADKREQQNRSARNGTESLRGTNEEKKNLAQATYCCYIQLHTSRKSANQKTDIEKKNEWHKTKSKKKRFSIEINEITNDPRRSPLSLSLLIIEI
jgi:DNA repair ATPase RecN